MIDYKVVIIVTAVIAAVAGVPSFQSVFRNTADRITEYNYPVETHTVHTSDGYILTLFRIPYSPRLQNQNEKRPVAFLETGLLATSDTWILNGPDNALAYLLADSGYDVWMGNARGTTYSKEHENLSTLLPSFWDFSWHEIALYDISASIDYILETTSEARLHYVGYSMGTTEFFVLMSERPEYNAKIKTAHMLAPVAFAGHMTSPIVIIAGPLFKYRSPITDILENKELLPNIKLVAWVLATLCEESSPIQPACIAALSALNGWNSTHVNKTMVSEYLETYPAGVSTNVLIHYGQEYESGHFRQYDYGPVGNLHRYKQIVPPDYNISNVVAPVWLYYGLNDYFGDVPDVKTLEGLLPNLVESFRVPYPDWNHLDFVIAYEVKETLYDRIISAANHFESTGEP